MKATVRELGGGRYGIEIRGVLPTGASVRERFTRPFHDAKTAKIWAQARIAHLVTGEAEANKPEAPTLEKFFDRFIREHCEANHHKPSGIQTKRWVFGAHLDKLQSKRLDEIDEAKVAKLRSELAEKGLKPKTVNNVLSLLASMFTAATEWGIVDHGPRIRLLKTAKKQMTFLSVEHYERLIAGAKKAGPHRLALILLAGDAGLRRGEILALEWGDIDLERGVLVVRRSEVLKRVGETKGLADRMVPLTELLAAALNAIKANRGRVLAGRGKGGRIDHKTLRSWVEESERAAKLPVTGKLHILRHTYASHLVAAGQSLYQLQMAMGHKDGTTTQGYAHMDPEALKALSRAINARRGSKGAGEIDAMKIPAKSSA